MYVHQFLYEYMFIRTMCTYQIFLYIYIYVYVALSLSLLPRIRATSDVL